MRAALPQIRHWLGRPSAAWVRRRGLGLSALAMVPNSLTMPLRRRGLHPLPELGRRRDADPVSRWGSLLGTRIWLVTGHPEARAVLANTVDFSNDIRPYLNPGDAAPERTIGGLGFTDPPDHARLRRLLAGQFTKHRLEALKPRISRLVDRQLDVIADSGPEVDLLQTFAFPIPFLVVCELLGLPDEDRETFQRIGAARFDLSHGGLGSFGALSQSRAFLLEVARKQRKAPGDGLIGMVVREYGDAVDDVELSGLADGVFIGGYETTASMLALGTLLVLEHPQGFGLLRAGPDSVEATIEELLRMLSVVQVGFPRFARRDLDLFGRHVRAGDVVICSLSEANRDPRLVADADRFDPQRSPSAHLAFGYGAHRCLGAEFARVELRTALPALAHRFPALTLAGDREQLSFRRLSIVYGLDRLPVRAW